jgi:hypothetical protein
MVYRSALVLVAMLGNFFTEEDKGHVFFSTPCLFIREREEGLKEILMKSGLNRLIDSRNGYMFLEGNGAQGSLEIAPFLYPNRQPLLVIAWGNDLEESFTNLSFYTES